MFKYSDIKKDSNLAFNPEISELSDPLTIDKKMEYTKNMYPDAVKYLTPNNPPPRGKSI